MPPEAVDPAAVERLRHKYDTLVALRRTHAATGEVASREALRALAGEFPGALRELDRMPFDELVRRAEALRSPTAPDFAGPMIAWHAGLREALAARRVEGARAGPSSERKRLSARVLEAVAARYGITAEAMRATLFGSAKVEPCGEGGGPL